MTVLIDLFLLVCAAAAFLGKKASEQGTPLMVRVPVKVITEKKF